MSFVLKPGVLMSLFWSPKFLSLWFGDRRFDVFGMDPGVCMSLFWSPGVLMSLFWSPEFGCHCLNPGVDVIVLEPGVLMSFV